MINQIKLQILFIVMMIGIIAIPNIQAQGLQFYGNKMPISQRTSYRIFNEKSAPAFNNYIRINFELKIQDFYTFGYLLHIVDPVTDTAYSLTFTDIDKGVSAFKFNTEGKSNLISMSFINDSIRSKWIPVTLQIDLSTGQSTLTIAGRSAQSNANIKVSGKMQPALYFGSKKDLLDLPSFAIRWLSLEGARQSFSFLFNESYGEDVHDTEGNVQGRVTNPCWLINDSYHWKKAATIDSRTCIGSKFNEVEQNIQFINQDSLYTYQVDNKRLSSHAYANPMPVQMLLGTNFIDTKTNTLYAYEINNLPKTAITIGALDIGTLTWQPVGKAYTYTQLHHHNGFLDQKRNRYLVFGGFGSKQYSNKFITYNSLADRWDTLQFKGDNIAPRFNSSMAATRQGDHLYIYGGVGNESGDQSVGHNYYNDLYLIDLENQTVKECWDKPLDETLVPAGQMVLSPDERFLYVLRYAEYIKSSHVQLYRISVADGKMEQLGDSIPFVSGSITSNIALYYNSVLEEFYCILQEFNEVDKSMKAIVYTLSAPPANKATMEFYTVSPKWNYRNVLLIGLISIPILCIIILFIYKREHKRRRVKRVAAIEPVAVAPSADAPLQSVTRVTNPVLPETKTVSKPEINKIYIYGIFTVYGSSGRDITHLFSNKLKHIFLYILLNSTKEGVSSSSLNDIFWPGKTEEKVKNLKGVTVSNLRKALAEINGIELIYEKGFFKIVINEPCCCDFFCLHTHLKSHPQSYDYMLPIWERGKLLESSSLELFDRYKQYSEDIIFSSLPKELPVCYQQNKLKYVLRICAILLKRDPLYEPALIYSIYSYEQLNKFELLSKVYSTFIIEYRNTMGEDYPKSLDMLRQEGKQMVFPEL